MRRLVATVWLGIAACQDAPLDKGDTGAETGIPSGDTPLDTPSDTPLDTPSDTPLDTPLDTPADTPTESPADTPSDTPTDPIDSSGDTYADTDGPETGSTAESGLLETGADTSAPVDTGTATYPAYDVTTLRTVPPADGTILRLPDVIVTGKGSDDFWVADQQATASRGIRIHAPFALAAPRSVRETVAVRGVYREVSTGLGTDRFIDVTDPAIGVARRVFAGVVPPPHALNFQDLAAANADPAVWDDWNGALVRFSGVPVWDPGADFTNVLGDAQTQMTLSGYLYYAGALAYGDRFTQITGLLGWADGGWVLYPRDQVDTSGFVGWTGGVEALAVGDLVLSEVFSASSSSACGTDGSYLEVANVSGRDVDLDGLLVYDLGADRPLFQVRATTPVASGDRAVFVSGGDLNCLGLVSDVATTWSYPGTFLGLYNRRSLFDLLFPGAAVPAVGAAAELKDAYLDANSNDVAAAWCSATVPFVGSDLGTPGGPASCGAP